VVIGIGIACGSVGCQAQDAARIPASHPASAALKKLFSTPAATDFRATSVHRDDYLTLVAADIDFFKQYQNEAGAIIDPVRHEEIQYSTPAFALAAATLAAERNREDLLDPAVRAMTFATHALANHTSANGHADFYIPLLMHTRRILKDHVAKETLAKWDADFGQIVPETHYHDAAAQMNWNIVNVDGESQRRTEGLVVADQLPAQEKYIERSLAKQQSHFTRFGMYDDPNGPLAYDAFPRLWLEDLMAGGQFQGAHAQDIRDFLLAGGLSSLLMLSPTGEWAEGGRSAQHQWNEAQMVVIFEINAQKWHAMGCEQIAGAMKRSAHLAFGSMLRWQRPSGELWIIKNHAEPQTRLGFEDYSSHSQYNLLPMAMLCMAFGYANESIHEQPAPCEVGGFVFDVRETFHKVFANAGGMYVEIDTAADAHYNATGLQRVHRKDVPLSPLSDSTAAERAYGPNGDANRAAMSPGIQWMSEGKDTNGRWMSLGDFVNATQPKPERGEGVVASTDLAIQTQAPRRVSFNLTYHLLGAGDVAESYSISPDQVEGKSELRGNRTGKTRVLFPVLVNDGSQDLPVKVSAGRITEKRDDSVLNWQIISPLDISLSVQGPRIPCHNGYMQAAIGDLPDKTGRFTWRLTLERAK
jgi:hypothetical protein